MPQEVLEQYRRERDELIRAAEREDHLLSWAEQKRLFELYSERIDAHLDAGRGDCWLRQEGLAKLVAEALQFFDGERYALGAWVVMPNHVHAVVRPEGEHLLDEILRSWKGYTGRVANQALGRIGQSFWAREYYDHWIRDDAEHARFTAYIHDNPRKAGLCAVAAEWPWSSAHPRWGRRA